MGSPRFRKQVSRYVHLEHLNKKMVLRWSYRERKWTTMNKCKVRLELTKMSMVGTR
jgi:hypothetical protein